MIKMTVVCYLLDRASNLFNDQDDRCWLSSSMQLFSVCYRYWPDCPFIFCVLILLNYFYFILLLFSFNWPLLLIYSTLINVHCMTVNLSLWMRGVNYSTYRFFCGKERIVHISILHGKLKKKLRVKTTARKPGKTASSLILPKIYSKKC